MSSKKTTNTQQTVTPTNPEWVTKGTNQLSDLITGLASQDPGSFVAGLNDRQNQYSDLMARLGAQGAAQLDQAASMANPQAATVQAGPASHATAQTAYQGINNYLNPYTSYVAGNTLNDLGRGLSIAQTGNGRDALLAGQYGGSRQGVVDANLNRDFFDRVGSTLGNLYSSGFNSALGGANQDADRAQQTSVFNAGADNTLTALNAQLAQQTGLANQSATQRAAEILSGIGQYGLNGLQSAGNTQYAIDQAQAQAPLTTAQLLASAYGGLPLNLFHGENTTGKTVEKSSDPLGIASQLLKIATGPPGVATALRSL